MASHFRHTRARLQRALSFIGVLAFANSKIGGGQAGWAIALTFSDTHVAMLKADLCR